MFSLSDLNPYKWAAIGTAVIVSLGSASFIGFQVGSTFTQGRWDSAVIAQAKGEAAALKAAAEAIAKIEVKSETHIQPLRTEIRTNTVYRDCKHSPDSVRNLNALITGVEQPRTGDSSLPASKRAR